MIMPEKHNSHHIITLLFFVNDAAAAACDMTIGMVPTWRKSASGI
jgi:hypothetical protein